MPGQGAHDGLHGKAVLDEVLVGHLRLQKGQGLGAIHSGVLFGDWRIAASDASGWLGLAIQSCVFTTGKGPAGCLRGIHAATWCFT